MTVDGTIFTINENINSYKNFSTVNDISLTCDKTIKSHLVVNQNRMTFQFMLQLTVYQAKHYGLKYLNRTVTLPFQYAILIKQ